MIVTLFPIIARDLSLGYAAIGVVTGALSLAAARLIMDFADGACMPARIAGILALDIIEAQNHIATETMQLRAGPLAKLSAKSFSPCAVAVE